MSVVLTDSDGIEVVRKAHIIVSAPDNTRKLCISAAHAAAYLAAQSPPVPVSSSDIYNVLKAHRCKRACERLSRVGYEITSVPSFD